MENTICPWCQTEIVWDEEIGPEEECPHCHNELKGYRTLNITLGDEDDEVVEEETSAAAFGRQEEEVEADDLWEQEESRRPRQGIRRLGSVSGQAPDLIAYETAVARLQEMQEQLPECPHCREYMLLAGQQMIPENSFKEHVPYGVKHSLMNGPVELNLFVCPVCFHTSTFLSDQSRLQLVRNIQKSMD